MKTNFDRFIAIFIETEGIESDDNGKTWRGGQTNKHMVFYLLKDKLISCKWIY